MADGYGFMAESRKPRADSCPRRRDDDPPDGDRLQVFLRPARPVFVVDLDGGDRKARGQRALRLVAVVCGGEEDADRRAALLDRRGAEVVDDREEQLRSIRANVDRGVRLHVLAEHVLDAIEEVALVLLVLV